MEIWVDKKYIDTANEYQIDDYLVMDCKYHYHAGPYSFSLAIHNISNEIYSEYGKSNGGPYVYNQPVVFPADRRGITGKVRMAF